MAAATWTPEDCPAIDAAPARVAAVDASVVFATTTGQEVLQTLDGGRSWTVSSLPGRHEGLSDVSAVRDRTW